MLTGKAMPQDAPIAGPKGVAGANVTLKSARVQGDRQAPAARWSPTAGERIPYDALVLATGSRNRILPMFPEGQPGIYYLRTADEALALKAHLGLAKSLLLIGGGVVGLEIAASAAELGIKVTVIEIAPRILARVCDEETSAIIHQRHRDHGVDIRTGTVCAGLQALPDGRLAVVTKAGETLAADLIVVGAGAVPDDALAKAAGLARAGRHPGRRPRPHLRSRDLRGRRLHALRRPERSGAAGELAARAGARRRGRTQRGRRRRRLQCGAVVLVGAVRPLHPGHGLAGRAAERAGAPQDQ